jgi:hypothetical protein
LHNNLPDEVSNSEDRGDDTQRRFRFQAAYAASLSLLLLNENSEYEALYCEQLEDILVKLTNNKFIGIQVKTRENTRGPFKFQDPEIMHTIERFVRHEKDFPNHFLNYVICSNCGFVEKKDSSSLSHCLKILTKHNGSKSCLLELNFSDRIREISKVAECREDLVLAALNKVKIVNWADLANYEKILVSDIATFTHNERQSYDVLQKMANRLIGITSKAASLSLDLSYPSCYELLKDPQKALLNSTIQNKRITANIVEDSLRQSWNPVIILQGVKPIQISALPKGMNIMELKMATGGIDFSNIDLMKDLNASSLTLLIEWLHIHGTAEADRRAEHLRLIVQTECQEAHDSTRNLTMPYGKEMLQAVRKRLRGKHEEMKQLYVDCLYNHLLGIAGILTEDCKIWWSEIFDLPTELTV